LFSNGGKRNDNKTTLIAERAGLQNNYIFGAEADEIDRLKKEGYKPEAYAEKHSYAVESLVDGTFSDGGTGWFKELYESLYRNRIRNSHLGNLIF